MPQLQPANAEAMLTPLGTWTVDLRQQRCFLDQKLAWLFGVSEAQGQAGASRDQIMENIALPDRAAMSNQWRIAKDDGGIFDCQFRIKTRDGRFQAVRSIGACHRDENGEPYLFSGQIMALQSRDDEAPASAIDFLIRHTTRLAEAQKKGMLVYLLEMARLENEKPGE